MTNKLRILLAATGSVAAMKIPLLLNSFDGDNFEVRLILTENAKRFINFEGINLDLVYDDAKEWSMWQGRGDPVLHVDLAKWADVLLIAPLDANTLAKISQGLCDNLLTCTVRAWDISKPLYFCPAMNTRMYEHPITATQISTLKGWGYHEIPAIEKTLVCGDTGMGAMAEVDTIVNVIKELHRNS